MGVQTIEVSDNAVIPGRKVIRIRDLDRKPHWKRFGSGYMSMEINIHKYIQFIEIDTVETATFHGSGKVSMKRTMVTLDPATAQTLYNAMKEIFEP